MNTEQLPPVPTPDDDAALAFLAWLYPDGPWLLSAIGVESQEITTSTFRPGQQGEKLLRTWLRQYRTRNIYYSVNEPMRDLRKKAERTDLLAMRFLHVDVDPATGVLGEGATEAERLAAGVVKERARILALLRDDKIVPRPSAIVYSGGGYNALYRLDAPVPLNGDLAAAEEAKRYNLQLEIILGGDNCHNVDRILRLPGTVNWPNKKKQRRGRAVGLARVLYLDDTSYPLAAFTAAQPVQTATRAFASGLGSNLGGSVPVNVSGNVRRLDDVGELGERVTDVTKMLIVQGYDVTEPDKWAGRRSELLFYVCCELARADVTDDVMYAVITDPDFGISSSVLEKGNSFERYALRQIQRAREHILSPHLREMNERFAVVGNVGGKCRVIEEVFDAGLSRGRISKQSFDDFRNRFMHKRIAVGHDKKGNEVLGQLGTWWLEQAHRRQYEGITFAPGREVAGYYNLWKGFACPARPGDKHHGLLEHIRDNVCAGDVDHYDYLMSWMARTVQHPDTRGEVAVVMRGGQGTGKGFVAREFGKLWGQHFLQITNPQHLVGVFNAHMRDCVVMFADEAFYAGDKRHESILKGLITEELVMVEEKGVNAEQSRNYLHLMMASNNNWVVPAGPEERRFFIVDVARHQMQNSDYFADLAKQLDAGGRENFLHHLLTLDISEFEVRRVPKTEALREQKKLSLSTEEEWWYSKLEDGELLARHQGWDHPVLKRDLVDDYFKYAQKVGTIRRANATALGRFLSRALPRRDGGESRLESRQVRVAYTTPSGDRTEHRGYAWVFPELAACREHWDVNYGGPYDWQPAGEHPNGTQLIHAF